MTNPDSIKLTIGITTCNRLKYVKALINSLAPILNSPNVDSQVIVVDNASSEIGMKNFLDDFSKSRDNVAVFRREKRDWINDEYHAKNVIIENSSNDMILFLQDDLQFVSTAQSFIEYVKDFSRMKEYNLDATGVRRQTLDNVIDKTSLHATATGNKFWNLKDDHFSTTGFFKKEIFEKVGLYPVSWPQEKTYWGRSEDVYNMMVHKFAGENAKTIVKAHVPLFISVWNDPRGGYAIIRGDYRYGHYLDPVDSTNLYYKHMDQRKVKTLMRKELPATFIDVAEPLGWDLAMTLDKKDHVKFPQNELLLVGPVTPLIERIEFVDPEIEKWLND